MQAGAERESVCPSLPAAMMVAIPAVRRLSIASFSELFATSQEEVEV
jgi:hypothetical protein